jgi:hypothetical protein
MGLFRMLIRAAFICNICFLVALGFLHYKGLIREDLSSMIIVMGIFLSVILNGVMLFWLLILLLMRKPVIGLPKPLIITNAGFLTIQLFLLIKSIHYP